MLTEAEAKQRLCPAAGMKDRCVTTNCMAWQWVNKVHRRSTELWSRSKNERVNSAFGDDAWWRPVDGEPTEPPAAVGRCTLMRANADPHS